jgi:ubiquinone/menaquinone biosynthesis C-methylase UbiE
MTTSHRRIASKGRALIRRLIAIRSDALHPWRYITGAAGRGTAFGRVKGLTVRLLYDYMARAYPQADWTTMNYGYAALPGENGQAAVDLTIAEHLSLQLYMRVATSGARGGAWCGLEVLEIGSGRGGGAAYLACRLAPRRLVGLDLSAAATALARRRHGSAPPLEYRQGDAEALPFDAETFDLVLNVESAHCYASIPRFLSEVHRVLRPGGELLFADFVSRQSAFGRLQEMLVASPLALVALDEITENVLASLAADEARKRVMLDRWVKRPFKSFAEGAYAMAGTEMRHALQSGETVYVAAVLCKVVAG